MFHRLWTLIRKNCNQLLREDRKRARSDSAGADSGHPVSVRRDA